MITRRYLTGSPTWRAGCSLGLIAAEATTGQGMMQLDPSILEKRELIKRIAAEHGARNVRVFGSRARGDARPDSDVDLLVEPGPATSSWFPAGLVLDLEELLGLPVDVVTDRGLRPELRDTVLGEAVQL
jgi:hypothetical protein